MRRNTSNPRAIIWLLVVVAVIVLAVVFATNSQSSLAPHGTRRVTFRVESAGGYANITLKAGTVVIEKPQTLTTPWERTIDVARSESVYLTAANPTQTGQLTCKISIDREPWKSETIPAPKDGVACAGIIP